MVEDLTKKAAEMLLKGATLLSEPCPYCKGVRVMKEGQAVICNTCGLPEDLCACGELAKDSTKIIIRLETRRFKKKGTMIEGLDPKLNNLETVAKELKNKYACGGTAKEGYIFLQGDHRDTIKDTLINLGFAEDTIELH